jgi:hypothetical protein
MLALKRSLLNGEYILINVLKALVSFISTCNYRTLHRDVLNKDKISSR